MSDHFQSSVADDCLCMKLSVLLNKLFNFLPFLRNPESFLTSAMKMPCVQVKKQQTIPKRKEQTSISIGEGFKLP